MPTYDYVCGACGHAFEHFQEMSAKRLRTCPRCKKPRLERQVGTGAGLIFKGSGFYITDYRNKSGGESKTSNDAKTAGETKPSAPSTTTAPATPAKSAATPAKA
jgi:putative FmdB family regulatory protein